MTTPTCRCGKPVNGTTLCRDCKHTLDVALGNIAACAADLAQVRTRMHGTRYDLPRGKGPSRYTPLGMDLRFTPDGAGTLALEAARKAVVRWCQQIRSEHPSWPGPARQTVSGYCSWLQTHLSVIATATWAHDCKRDLLDVERELKRVDARGPERIYAGLCTVCLAVGERSGLWAMPGDEWVTCPARDCGMDYRVADRRALMQADLDGRLCTAAEIAEFATYLELLDDRERTRKRVNLWHHRGTLVAASVTREGEPLFVFGEVVQRLHHADSKRRAETATRRRGA